MEARALEVGFRHLAAPLRQTFGPHAATLDGTAFPTGGNLALATTALPSWSIDGPTGFNFQYAVPAAARASFLAQSIYGVAVTLYRLWETAPSVWTEQAKWRFVGRIVDSSYDAANGVAVLTATPWSRTRQARPYAPGWSHQEQLDLSDGADTLLRWTRAARRLHAPVEEA